MSLGWDAYLYLEKGHLYSGYGLGAELSRGGEAVFNTGMSGYQEIFTDPSYSHQIVVMTYPHIGNTGINAEDIESKGLSLSGVVMRDYCEVPSNWRSTKTLDMYLKESGVPAIYDVDTREITTLLREEGAQRAVIFSKSQLKGQDPKKFAETLLKGVPEMEGLDLVSLLSTKQPYAFNAEGKNGTVVVYDFGAKSNILRGFAQRGFKVWVVPYNFPRVEALKYNPSAVVLTNGPGDPAKVPSSVQEIQGMVGQVPIFAVCMGHQLLGRALGASTYKLKFGHHGVNHPVMDTLSNRIVITSQNHGFCVSAEDLSKNKDIVISHVSLNDQTLEGFQSKKMKLCSVQFHPEAKPGPNDASYLFDHFIRGFLQ